ncbi:unnamed protein product [Cylindrotheca closterium]|uniref:Uncharacterized protein n=1 Tax=Cylindrotheca closterium TaxID=2856 RepID=A0AAD2G9F8_9STRA|nr:unnamed protein product [Cylindrotheca closterium]
MRLVRCFMLSFVLIKALDCLVPSAAAQPTVEEMPSNSPIHPTSIVNASYDTRFNQSEDDASSFEQDRISPLWFCFVLAPLIYFAYQSYLNTERISTFLKPSHDSSIPFASSVGTMALLCAVVLAQISFDQSSIVSSCTFFSTWYMQKLEANPLVTNCLTSAVFTWVGDVIAQGFGEMIHSDKSFFENYDKRRGFAFILDGIILSGPLLHYSFELMESIFPTEGEDGTILSSIIHVFLTDYVVDTIYIFLSFVLVAMVEGEVHDLKKILRQNFLSTVKASGFTNLSLAPFEFVCFRYLSVGYRVLVMNMIDVIWQAVVSFFAHRGRKHAHQDPVDYEGDKASLIAPTAAG